MTIDYRVDTAKMIWRPQLTNAPVPPIQCTAYRERQKRRSLLDRLSRFLFPRSFETFVAEREANRCIMFLGHWSYENQREHVNGWDERWPVSADDTRPFNPTEPAL